MDDLIRETIQGALANGAPPPGLRARVIASVPMGHGAAGRMRVPTVTGQWAATFAAILLTAALVVGVVDSRIVNQNQLQHGPVVPNVRLTAPQGLAVGPDGTVYVSDFGGNRVYRIQRNNLVTVAGGGLLYEGPATRANLFGPVGLAFSATGDLYIADNLGTTIRKLDRKGVLSTFVAVHATGGADSPLGLAFDQTGLLYVGDLGGIVAAVRPDGSFSAFDLSGVPSPAVLPGYVAVDTAGNLYVADRSPITSLPGQVPTPPGGCRIVRIAPDRSVSVIAGTGMCGYSGDGGQASKAELDNPSGIAFDAVGNLYFADSNNHRVRRIDQRGIITTIAGTGVPSHAGDGGPAVKAQLAYPYGLEIVGGRFLYVTDTEYHPDGGQLCNCAAVAHYGAVRVIDLQTGTISTLVSSNSRVIG